MKVNLMIIYGKLIYEYKDVTIVPSVGDTVVVGGAALKANYRLFDYYKNTVTVKVWVA